MVTVLIFWSVILAGVFYILALILKGLVSALNALFVSGTVVFVGGFFSAISVTILWTIYTIVQTILAGHFGEMMVYLLITVVFLGGIIFIIGSFGVLAVELVAIAFMKVAAFLAVTLNSVASLCESIYYYFLGVIMNQIERI